MNTGLGPLTALNAARRARASDTKDAAPWDEMRVIFRIKTSKSRDEYTAHVNAVRNWPTGWKLTIISGERHQGDGKLSVYFAVDHPPQNAAGAFVRANLSLIA